MSGTLKAPVLPLKRQQRGQLQEPYGSLYYWLALRVNHTMRRPHNGGARLRMPRPNRDA